MARGPLQCETCGAAFTQARGRPAGQCRACRLAAGLRLRDLPPPTVELTAGLAATVTRQRAAIELAKAHLQEGQLRAALLVLQQVPSVAEILTAGLIPEQRTSPENGVPSQL